MSHIHCQDSRSLLVPWLKFRESLYDFSCWCWLALLFPSCKKHPPLHFFFLQPPISPHPFSVKSDFPTKKLESAWVSPLPDIQSITQTHCAGRMTTHSCSAICKITSHRTAMQQVCWGHPETRFLSGWLQWLKILLVHTSWFFCLPPPPLFFFLFDGAYWMILNMHYKNILIYLDQPTSPWSESQSFPPSALQ